MERKWSAYQEAIFSWVLNTRKSVCVDAKAGSGKSTTAIEAAKRLSAKDPSKSILFLAFNNSIAKKNADDVSGYRNIESKTLHSYGFKAIFRAYGNDVKVDNTKWSRFIRENISSLSSYITDDMNANNINSFVSQVVNILNLCRINLVREGHVDMIQAIADKHNFELVGDEVNVVNTILSKCYCMDANNVIDFTDMITLPLVDTFIGKKLWQYDVVFIDEAQDLSLAQQQLMLKAVKRNGFFVAVGDPQQAINGFAGAMNDSFAQLVDLAHGNTLPLSVNYRCGKNIIREAQGIVPTIEAFEGSPEGVINRNVTDLKSVGTNDMLLCRKSAPLVGLCLKFIANGKSAYVKGKDICEGLKNLIKKMKAKNIDFLYNKLDKEYEKLVAAAIKEGGDANSPKPVAFKDKMDCIHLIGDTCTSIAEVIQRLDTLFDDSRNGRAICLSTVHKAKGLECDNVFILLPDKLPMVWKGQKQWEYEQEMNLRYVAITRAKKVLNFVTLDENALKSIEL